MKADELLSLFQSDKRMVLCPFCLMLLFSPFAMSLTKSMNHSSPFLVSFLYTVETFLRLSIVLTALIYSTNAISINCFNLFSCRLW